MTTKQNENVPNQDQLNKMYSGSKLTDNEPTPDQGDPNCIYTYEREVTETKQQRKDADAVLQKVKSMPPSRERSLAITKFQEGIMWLGMDLKRLGEANPYPNSYNSENTKIEPTADNLKL